MMSDLKLDKLTTESRNLNTSNIDKVSTLEMVKIINNEDKKVAEAVPFHKNLFQFQPQFPCEHLARIQDIGRPHLQERDLLPLLRDPCIHSAGTT